VTRRKPDPARTLTARWCKHEADVIFDGPGARMLCDAMAIHKWLNNKTVLNELRDRGFNLHTLRFSCEMFPPPPDNVAPAKCGPVNVDANGAPL
jgi:hypothetical protein